MIARHALVSAMALACLSFAAPAHDHAVDEHGGHQHGLQGLAAYALGAAVAITGGGSGGNTALATTGITIDSAGQGLPTQLIQPGMIGTYYIKL